MIARQTRMDGQKEDEPDVIPMDRVPNPWRWFWRWVIFEIVVFVVLTALFYAFAP